jgi:hypothetical protein
MFGMLGMDIGTQFAKFFHGPRPSHEELLRFVRSVEGRAAGRCPLCRFPTARLREGERLHAQVTEAIRRDFPGFRPSQGICMQCADLYEARASSGAGTVRRS